MRETLRPCPDCGCKPTVSDMKTVHGLYSGKIIECLNEKCPGISPRGVNRYAYSESEWNLKRAFAFATKAEG